MDHPPSAWCHVAQRQAADRRGCHLHLPADHQPEEPGTRRSAARPDRRGEHEEGGQPDGAGSMSHAVFDAQRRDRRLVLQRHPCRLQPEGADRHRPVQSEQVHARCRKRVRSQRELLAGGPPVPGRAHHQRLLERDSADKCPSLQRGRRRRCPVGGVHPGRSQRGLPDTALEDERIHTFVHAARRRPLQRRTGKPSNASRL